LLFVAGFVYMEFASCSAVAPTAVHEIL
jgi:hypothetical protein